MHTTEASLFIELFDVNVELVEEDGKVVRGSNYVDCRVTYYAIKSQRYKERSTLGDFVNYLRLYLPRISSTHLYMMYCLSRMTGSVL